MKKLIKYILIAIMLVCTSIGISIALTSQLETPEVASTDIKGANNEVINPGETTGGTTGDAVEDHVIEDAGDIFVVQEPLMGDGIWRPISDQGKEQEIYCIEPGVSIKISGLTKGDVYSYNGQVCVRDCGQCADWGDAKFSSGKYAGRPKFSNPYYYCQGDHVTEESTQVMVNV